MWQQFLNNPAGRSVGDCAVRAVSAALDITWEQAYLLITAAGFSMADMPSSNSVWGAVLRQHGFTRHNLPPTCPDCYTFADFAAEHPHGVYVLGTGTHVATIKDSVIMDAWNSSNEIPQYYWHKGE